MRLVDLALVLAIDTSGSISNERLAMQLGGYVQAFRQPGLVRAIQAGNCGQIAVTFVSWSDYQRQFQEVPWTVLSDQISAVAFSNAIAHAIPPTPGWTSISGAIGFSAHLLGALPVQADRRVIDISGDGPNNDGPPPGAARDAAIAAGITINGLPILEVDPHLDRYYRSQVIGGPNAFLLVARNRVRFAEAVLRKLLIEIAGIPSAVDSHDLSARPV
jgi:hypothetical protein